MDWTPIIVPAVTGVGGALAGFTPSIKRWLDARAKRVENEAEEVTARSKARDAEVTAKVKLVEAQAEATKAEAQMDAATAKAIEVMQTDIKQCREEHEKCEAALADLRRWTQGELKQLQGDLDTLFVKSGLTPRDRTVP